MLSPEEIKKLFALARIEPSAEEVERLSKELGSILDYVKQLQSVVLTDVPPTLSFAPEDGVLRSDKTEVPEPSQVAALLKEFPQQEGDYLKTKKVFGG